MTAEELLQRIDEQMNSKHTAFYKIPAIRYSGECIEENVPYSEVSAKYLYESFDDQSDLIAFLLKYTNMKPEKQFTSEPIHRKEQIQYTKGSGRNEENIAKRLMQMNQLQIFENYMKMRIRDYQVPINRVNHSSEGKVDLVFSTPNQVVIGELKDEDSRETLLRAVVEVKSYQFLIESNETTLKRFVSCYIPDHEKNLSKYKTGLMIQPAVFIFRGNKSQPWKDFERILNNKCHYLRRLIARWDVMLFEVFSLDEDEDKAYEDREYAIKRVL